jgi:hypothetical protein
VPPMDPFKGDFELPTPKPIVCKLEQVRTKFVSNMGIPY